MFSYFKALRTTKSHLRYFAFCWNVLDAWGKNNNKKTGGQKGDPVEMIAFCLSIHHLWGRTLAKHYQDACAVAYTDDGYIKAKLSVALEVLSDIKHVLREDLSRAGQLWMRFGEEQWGGKWAGRLRVESTRERVDVGMLEQEGKSRAWKP